jgi:FAD:protein FMN transferase
MRTTDARRGRRISAAFAVAAVSAAAFFAVFGGLAQQLASGHDPALATVSTAPDPSQQARRILVRRIHRRIIVTQQLSGAIGRIGAGVLPVAGAIRTSDYEHRAGARPRPRSGSRSGPGHEIVVSEYDTQFECMGSQVRLLVGPPLARGLPSAEQTAAKARVWLDDYDHRLSRFRPDSELCRLNADPREEVKASLLLRRVIAAALWSAEHTGGLVDPTVIDRLEERGYSTSRAGVAGAPLADAFAAAPDRRPAAPDPRARWRAIQVDDERGTIRRPVGVRVDSGGVGKGFAADALATMFEGYSRFLIDCGGDIRVGGPDTLDRPYSVQVENPVSRRQAFAFALRAGAVATSGIDVRVWRSSDGRFAHHLIDPATGESAWTGLAGATALAPTALEAETLSKAALLSGPVGARNVLARHGGRIVHESGGAEMAGPLKVEFRLQVPA